MADQGLFAPNSEPSIEELYQGSLYAIQSVAAQKGYTDKDITVYMLSGHTPVFVAKPSVVESLKDSLTARGVFVDPIDSITRPDLTVGDDVRPFFENQFFHTQQLAESVGQKLLGLATVGLDGHMNFSQALDRSPRVFEPRYLEHILQMIKESNDRANLEYIPDRITFDATRELDWTKLSQVESNWLASFQSVRSQIELIIQSLIEARDSAALANAAEKLLREEEQGTASLSPFNLFFDRLQLRVPPANENHFNSESYLDTNLRRKFAHEAAKFLKGYHFIGPQFNREGLLAKPEILRPLSSFALLLGIRRIVDSPLFRFSMLHSSHFEVSFIRILKAYRIDRRDPTDNLTLEVFHWIAKNRDLSTIVQLAAFAMAAEIEGFAKTEQATGIRRADWERLYRNLANHVVYRPTQTSVGLYPMIEYPGAGTENVLVLMNSIESFRSKLGIARNIYKKYYSVYGQQQLVSVPLSTSQPANDLACKLLF